MVLVLASVHASRTRLEPASPPLQPLDAKFEKLKPVGGTAVTSWASHVDRKSVV